MRTSDCGAGERAEEERTTKRKKMKSGDKSSGRGVLGFGKQQIEI